MMRAARIGFGSLTLLALLGAGGAGLPAYQDDDSELEAAVVRRYGALAEELYATSLEQAHSMRVAVQGFLAEPSQVSLAAARTAWCVAHASYGRTEAMRFYGGPIDHADSRLELRINTWPVDEAFIGPVPGGSGGLIGRSEAYSVLDRELLLQLHQQDGETRVLLGFHAMEFLLWGQDTSTTGPGARPFTDYVEGVAPHAARRALYLDTITDLLCVQLAQVAGAWRAGPGSYRDEFEATPSAASARKILTGLAVLCAFEMAGERLAVPLETRDQEEEPSCFSDTTRADLCANVASLGLVLRGGDSAPIGPGMLDLAFATDADLAKTLEARLQVLEAAAEALPQPFDQAIQAADDDPRRMAIMATLEACEALSESLAKLGQARGWALPVQLPR